MSGRRLLVFAILAGLAGTWARVRAQGVPAATPRRVAVLTPGNRADDEPLGAPFFDEMRRLGWVEGRNITFDRVYGNERMALLPELASEMVARRPELIYVASPPAAGAAKRATSTIPIVFAVVVDPVGDGLVASLARPGGNVTGVAQSITESLAPKRIQLLREVLPAARHIGLLGNPLDPGWLTDYAAIAPLAKPLGLTFTVANATTPPEFDASVASLVEQRVQAILVGNGIAVTRRLQMMELAQRGRVPVIGFNLPMAEAGALLSFGPSIAAQTRRAAHLVDKVLRGAKPADIPVEAAMLFELVVNLNTAKTLGVVIPQSVLLRADQVIE